MFFSRPTRGDGFERNESIGEWCFRSNVEPSQDTQSEGSVLSMQERLAPAHDTGGSPASSGHRSLVGRTVGPMSAGSQRGSVLALASTAFGAGMLTLPWMMGNMGVACGILMLMFGACLNYISLRLLVNLAYATGHDRYGDAVKVAIGPRTAAVLDGMIAIYTWGNLAALLVFLSGFFPSLAEALHLPQWFHGGWKLIITTALFPSLPLSLARSLSALRYPMLLSVLGLVSLAVIIAVGAASRFKDVLHATSLDSKWWLTPSVPSWQAVPQCMAMVINAFNCHVSLFSTQGELVNPTPARLEKVLCRATFLQIAFYILLSISGALSFGPPCSGDGREVWCTPANVLAATHFQGVDSMICRGLMTFTVILCIPINVNAARTILEQRFFAPPASGAMSPRSSGWKSPLSVHVGLTVLLLGSATAVACVYSNITSLIGILGGGCAASFMFLLPMLTTFVIRGNHWQGPVASSPVLGRRVGVTRSGVIIAAVLLTVGLAFGYLGAVMSFLDLFK